MAKKGTTKKEGKKTAKKRGRPAKPKEKIKKEELLTENQELFLYFLVYEGLSQREAYRKAYPNCHAKDSVVDVKASTLLKVDKVRVRYQTMLEDRRRRRYSRAVARAPLVEDRLYNIAMGETKIKITDKKGREIEVYPNVKEQTRALGELNRVFSEVMNKQEFGATEDSRQVIINISPFEE
ncbi:MAG: hypothetical protein IKY90_00365 [Oscillospiraceae bacterium]|nr:hypothetical protein [Oscillospiraceae bacterium]